MAINIQFHYPSGASIYSLIFNDEREAYNHSSGLFYYMNDAQASGNFAYDLPEASGQAGTYVSSGLTFLGNNGHYLVELHTGATGTASPTYASLLGTQEFSYYDDNQVTLDTLQTSNTASDLNDQYYLTQITESLQGLDSKLIRRIYQTVNQIKKEI